MSNEPVRSGLWLEVPDHDARVHGACSELLHVWVEGDTGHGVSVALKVSLHSGVLLGKHSTHCTALFAQQKSARAEPSSQG